MVTSVALDPSALVERHTRMRRAPSWVDVVRVSPWTSKLSAQSPASKLPERASERQESPRVLSGPPLGSTVDVWAPEARSFWESMRA